MNEVVRELKASELPETLREGIDPSHLVQVRVRDLGAPISDEERELRRRELWELTMRLKRDRGPNSETTEDAVRRVDEFRDDWE